MGKCLVHENCDGPIRGVVGKDLGAVDYSCEHHTKTTFVNLDKLVERMNAIIFPGEIRGRGSLEDELIATANKCGFNKPVIADLWDTDNVYFFELSKVDHWEVDDDGNHIQLWEQVLTWEGKELEPRDKGEYEQEKRDEYERRQAEEKKQFNRGWGDDRPKKKPSGEGFIIGQGLGLKNRGDVS